MHCGGERPDVEICRKQDCFRSKLLGRIRSADFSEVRTPMACAVRRRLRRAQPTWSELLFCRVCCGDWALAGTKQAWLQGCAIALGTAEEGVVSGAFRPEATPGTANNSAASSVRLNRAKCRRFALPSLYRLCYMRFHHSSSKRGKNSAAK